MNLFKIKLKEEKKVINTEENLKLLTEWVEFTLKPIRLKTLAKLNLNEFDYKIEVIDNDVFKIYLEDELLTNSFSISIEEEIIVTFGVIYNFNNHKECIENKIKKLIYKLL